MSSPTFFELYGMLCDLLNVKSGVFRAHLADRLISVINPNQLRDEIFKKVKKTLQTDDKLVLKNVDRYMTEMAENERWFQMHKEIIEMLQYMRKSNWSSHVVSSSPFYQLYGMFLDLLNVKSGVFRKDLADRLVSEMTYYQLRDEILKKVKKAIETDDEMVLKNVNQYLNEMINKEWSGMCQEIVEKLEYTMSWSFTRTF